jgi:5-(carboxyamino)imidazole ribonucleotide mutase
MGAQVVILMGSKSDLEHAHKITAVLESFGILFSMHVASAHKSVQHLMQTIASYEQTQDAIVFIAIAGRSNALAGMLDANTVHPVITCPPTSSAFGGADIFSSLRMPSGVAPLVVLEPDAAALASAKILALADPALRAHIAAYHQQMIDSIVEADQSLQA